MTVSSRIGGFFVNILTFIPLYALLIAAAVLSAQTAVGLTKIKEVENLHYMVSWSTVALWSLTVAIFFVSFTFGPAILATPYLYGTLLIILCLGVGAIAGVCFYTAYILNKMTTTEQIKETYKNSLITGSLATGASVFMLIYAIYTMTSYSSSGGLAGDIDILKTVIAPELAIAQGAKRPNDGFQRELYRLQQPNRKNLNLYE